MDHRKRRTKFDREVAIGTIREFSLASRPQLARILLAVDRKRFRRAPPPRAGGNSRAADGKARAVALERLGNTLAGDARSHRLSDLQMGETRHHSGGMFSAKSGSPAAPFAGPLISSIASRSHRRGRLRPDRCAAGGVQALAGLPTSDQPPLGDVDVLGRERPAKPSRFDFAGDPGEASPDRLEIRRRQDPYGAEHARVRKRRPNVVER
jgi:hypothetical protein